MSSVTNDKGLKYIQLLWIFLRLGCGKAVELDRTAWKPGNEMEFELILIHRLQQMFKFSDADIQEKVLKRCLSQKLITEPYFQWQLNIVKCI